MREKRHEAHDTVQALDHIIATLESVVASNALWEKLTLPGPRSADSSGKANAGTPGPAHAGSLESDAADGLAQHAEEALGPGGENSVPPRSAGPGGNPLPQEAGPVREARPTRRVQILVALATSPARWWSAEELCAAIGVDNHRQLRGILSEMVRGGQLIKHKEPGRKHVFYRLAPEPAPQEETVMSG